MVLEGSDIFSVSDNVKFKRVLNSVFHVCLTSLHCNPFTTVLLGKQNCFGEKCVCQSKCHTREKQIYDSNLIDKVTKLHHYVANHVKGKALHDIVITLSNL